VLLLHLCVKDKKLRLDLNVSLKSLESCYFHNGLCTKPFGIQMLCQRFCASRISLNFSQALYSCLVTYLSASMKKLFFIFHFVHWLTDFDHCNPFYATLNFYLGFRIRESSLKSGPAQPLGELSRRFWPPTKKKKTLINQGPKIIKKKA
jgi:hypothetical protein